MVINTRIFFLLRNNANPNTKDNIKETMICIDKLKSIFNSSKNTYDPIGAKIPEIKNIT